MKKTIIPAVILALSLGLYACSDAAALTADNSYEETTSITESGTYTISEDIDGSIVIDAGDEDVIELVLDGCSVTSVDSAAIYVKNAGEVVITLAEGTVNTLSNITGFEADGDTNVDGVIFSKDDLTIEGEGTLIINSADHAIVSKDDLTVESGTITLNASGDGLQANDSLTVNGGTIDITSCTEGLEGTTVTINGGDISIVSSDDAINAASDSGDGMMSDPSCQILITGGTVSIITSGDGIDSNGDLTVTGGYITVSGPENSGNGSLDYAGTGSITGGTLIAAGMSGMEMNMSSASQGSILLSTGNMPAGTEVTVTDQSGTNILSFTPETSYSCVLISSPELEAGKTYTVSAGEFSEQITLEDCIYGQSGGFGELGGFGGGPGRGGGERPDGQIPPDFPDGSNGQLPPDLPDF